MRLPLALPVALAALAVSAFTALPASAQQAATKVQVGVLRCNVAPYVGFVLGSTREMTCEFTNELRGTAPAKARYGGSVARFGLDLGVGGPGVLGWAVLAPSNAPAPVNLAGKYVGVSADAAWGLGAGANVLLGGSNNTIALQPLSLEGTTGMAVGAGISDLTLTPAP